MADYIGYILSFAAAVTVALIEANAAKERKSAKEDRERAQHQAELRAKESRLSMEMADATLQLSVANCNALCGGHNNGNVEKAKQAAEDAQRKYHSFLETIATEIVTKV